VITINPLNAELNHICHLLALLGGHHILHISRIRVNNYICLMVSFLSTERSTSWYEIKHFLKLGNLPIIDDFPYTYSVDTKNK
jgi:hypothetical protein